MSVLFPCLGQPADAASSRYTQVLRRSELIDNYDVSGCYIVSEGPGNKTVLRFFQLRPGAYAMWEQVHAFLDGHFKELGVKNCYFPLFIPKHDLSVCGGVLTLTFFF